MGDTGLCPQNRTHPRNHLGMVTHPQRKARGGGGKSWRVSHTRGLSPRGRGPRCQHPVPACHWPGLDQWAGSPGCCLPPLAFLSWLWPRSRRGSCRTPQSFGVTSVSDLGSPRGGDTRARIDSRQAREGAGQDGLQAERGGWDLFCPDPSWHERGRASRGRKQVKHRLRYFPPLVQPWMQEICLPHSPTKATHSVCFCCEVLGHTGPEHQRDPGWGRGWSTCFV